MNYRSQLFVASVDPVIQKVHNPETPQHPQTTPSAQVPQPPPHSPTPSSVLSLAALAPL